ncbi:MAG: TM2 domain-containing protein [Candidatus Desantisbacteria bacterium]
MPTSGGQNNKWVSTLREKATESDKSWVTAFWLSVFLGPFGIDRFYLGYSVLGLLKLFTFGGFFFLWLLDIILLLLNKLRDAEGGVLRRSSFLRSGDP